MHNRSRVAHSRVGVVDVSVWLLCTTCDVVNYYQLGYCIILCQFVSTKMFEISKIITVRNMSNVVTMSHNNVERKEKT